MRNLLIAAALVGTAVSAASASVVYEGFDYPVGPLAGNTNSTAPATTNGVSDTNIWTFSKSGTATAGPDVTSGSLSYPGLPTSVGNSGLLSGINHTGLSADRIAIPDYKTGDTVYFSMIMQVPSGVTNYGTTSASGSFFTGLGYQPDSLGANTTFDGSSQTSAAPLVIRKATDESGYNIGIAYRDVAAARQFSTAEYTAGQTLFLVGKYVIGAGNADDAASLYINPDLSAGLEPASADVSSINSATSGQYDYFYGSTGIQLESTIRSFILRNNSVEPANMQVDELRIGSTWADVTSVPEPASLSLLGLGAAALMARRRHRGQA